MIIGVGIDAVQISSMRKLLADIDAFEKSIFCESERHAAHAILDPPVRFAGLFAVKEAVYKALAPRSRGASFDLRKICVEHAQDGSPHVTIDNYLSRIMDVAGVGSIEVSVTNEGDLAIAIAVAQTDLLT